MLALLVASPLYNGIFHFLGALNRMAECSNPLRLLQEATERSENCFLQSRRIKGSRSGGFK